MIPSFGWSMVNIVIVVSFCGSSRMDRQRREEELKGRSSKKGHEAEQSILNRVYNFSESLLYFLYSPLILFPFLGGVGGGWLLDHMDLLQLVADNSKFAFDSTFC